MHLRAELFPMLPCRAHTHLRPSLRAEEGDLLSVSGWPGAERSFPARVSLVSSGRRWLIAARQSDVVFHCSGLGAQQGHSIPSPTHRARRVRLGDLDEACQDPLHC